MFTNSQTNTSRGFIGLCIIMNLKIQSKSNFISFIILKSVLNNVLLVSWFINSNFNRILSNHTNLLINLIS